MPSFPPRSWLAVLLICSLSLLLPVAPASAESSPAPTENSIELLLETPDGEILPYNSPLVVGLYYPHGYNLILRNVSDAALTDLSLLAAPESIAAFPVALNPSTLPPGGELRFSVSASDGPYSEPTFGMSYELYGSGALLKRFGISFMGPLSGPHAESMFKWTSPTRLLLAGQALSVSTHIGDDHRVVESTWFRNNKKVGTSTKLQKESAQLSDAGIYIQKIEYALAGSGGGGGAGIATASTGHTTKRLWGPGSGLATSPDILLGVVEPAPATASAYVGKPFSLTCTSAGPRGYPLSYQWTRNGEPTEDVDGVKGSAKAKLEFPADHPLRSGTFECVVTLTGPDRAITLSHGETVVTEASAPDVAEVDLTLLQRYVGEEISLQLTTTDPASRFIAKKLPPGLTMDSTGLITGRLTQAGSYTSTITASNPAGTGASQTLVWTILSALAVGSYHGLIDREAELDAGLALGSRVSLTVSKTGTFSGQLIHGGKAWRFTSKNVTVEAEAGEDPAITILISRGKTLPALTLSVDTETETLTLTDGTATTAGLLRRAVFDKATPATTYAGYYTAALERQVDLADLANPRIPAGLGYFTGTLSKTGVFAWRGKLADGTAITGSAPLTARAGGELLHLPVHLPLYKATGSVHGWANIPVPANRQLYGPLSWNKAPMETASRVYQDGIPLHTLYLSAVAYTPPEKGSLLFGVEDEPGNLGLIFYGPGIVPGSPIRNIISLRAGNKIFPPALSPTTPLKSLTLNVAKGTFKGTVTFLDESDPKLNRTVTTEGVMLSELGGAIGFFLLPDLPDETTTLKTSRLRSGSIDFHPR